MAHDNNPKKNTPEYVEYQRGLVSHGDRRRDSLPEIQFVQWLAAQSSMHIDQEGGIYYHQHGIVPWTTASGHPPGCLLDCLFDWLYTTCTDGRESAFQYFEHFEEWLLFMMSIMDQVRRGVLFGETGSDDWTLEEIGAGCEPVKSLPKLREELGWVLDLSALEFFERPLDRSHPALDRRNFERLRARYLATQEK